MSPEQLAALYDAAEAADDPVLAIALLRALADDGFKTQARALLEAPPEARRALTAPLPRRAGRAANEG